MISFADEYRRKVESVSRKSSYREKAFYSYLTNTTCPSVYSPETSLSELDRVCRFVFCKSSPDSEETVDQIIQKHRGRQADRPGHYSDSVILLSAFSLYSFADEREYIEKRFRNGSSVQRFLLSRGLPDVNVRFDTVELGQPGKPINSIESIADLLLSGNTDFISREGLIQGLIEADSLVECFVVLKAYHARLQESPLPELKTDLIDIAEALDFTIGKLRKRAWYYAVVVSAILGIAILASSILLIGTVAPTLTPEQQFIYGAILSVIGSLASLFLPQAVFDWSVFDWIKRQTETMILKRFGVSKGSSVGYLASHYAGLSENYPDMTDEFVLGRRANYE